MRSTSLKLLTALLCAVSIAATTAVADVIDDVKLRGVLIVGVKADYPPYGYLNDQGEIVGIEIDLAQDVADALSVGLDLIPVVASNRMQFLDQGRIDLMIATMTDTEERRQAVSIVEPSYYSSGVNILATKQAGFTEWSDLDGLPVCGIQGAFYNRRTQQEFGAEIVAFAGTAEALTALQQGRCVAFVYDDSFLISKLQEPEWSEFEMPLETIDDSPWGLAVAHGEERFYNFMSELVKRWHKEGRILELETEYGIPNTPFAQRMHEEYRDYEPVPLKQILDN